MMFEMYIADLLRTCLDNPPIERLNVMFDKHYPLFSNLKPGQLSSLIRVLNPDEQEENRIRREKRRQYLIAKRNQQNAEY
jgi:hypothetical protein